MLRLGFCCWTDPLSETRCCCPLLWPTRAPLPAPLGHETFAVSPSGSLFRVVRDEREGVAPLEDGSDGDDVVPSNSNAGRARGLQVNPGPSRSCCRQGPLQRSCSTSSQIPLYCSRHATLVFHFDAPCHASPLGWHPISFLPGGIDGQYHQLSMARSETNQWSVIGAPEVASYPIQGITAVPLASSGQLSKSRVTKDRGAVLHKFGHRSSSACSCAHLNASSSLFLA